ncbi:hypothetical protein EDB86DRAFT_2967798 [Lactarius hatsudake]|nr:hypothetical protein EDB86DRAFT_2967798 [Lactarius hatsudake]
MGTTSAGHPTGPPAHHVRRCTPLRVSASKASSYNSYDDGHSNSSAERSNVNAGYRFSMQRSQNRSRHCSSIHSSINVQRILVGVSCARNGGRTSAPPRACPVATIPGCVPCDERPGKQILRVGADLRPRAFAFAVVVVPDYFVRKCLVSALPPHPRTNSDSNARRGIDDAVHNGRSALTLAQSRRRHKVVVARVLRQQADGVFLVVVFVRPA